MATLTLPNVPDDLHRRLQERAARNRRSLDREVVDALERFLDEEPRPSAEPDLAWERASALRDQLRADGVSLTDEEIEDAIANGRP